MRADEGLEEGAVAVVELGEEDADVEGGLAADLVAPDDDAVRVELGHGLRPSETRAQKWCRRFASLRRTCDSIGKWAE